MPSPPPDEFLRATRCALCAQGYADLTMQDIADESTRSKAALHYHYDSKQDLLEAFLDYIADRFLTRVREADRAAGADPRQRLDAVLDGALSAPECEELAEVQMALLELKAQAPHEPAFRDRIREADATFRTLLVDILEAGVESGTFRPETDPGATARFVVNVLSGAQLRQVSVGQDTDEVRELLDTHLRRQVYAGRESDG